MKQFILGADPGIHGAFALLSTVFNAGIIEADDLILHPFRTDKKTAKLDVCDMRCFLEPYRNQIVAGYLEHVHSLGNAAAAATFSFGFNTGIAYAVMDMLNVPVHHVSPAVWQRNVWQTKDFVFKQNTKKDTKATSLNAAHGIFPGISFIMPRGRSPHDGCVDAALIAYYGYLHAHNRAVGALSSGHRRK